MIHLDSHDAVELHDRCEGCNAILRRAFNDIMPELDLGPNGPSMLIERIREIAEDLHATGAAS